CLVVRDLSRFGRDYIETGSYLERIFPQIGLRFIAIKEHYDNFDTDGSNESLMIPLQNMINALYSKDISRKVSTALKAQMEQGTFQKRNLPYGYRWNEDYTNMVIDEETAQYVRLMFQWKIEGWSIPTILNELDRLGAPNTELRRRQNGTRTGDGCSCKGWYSSTLYGILTNPHYVGDRFHRPSENSITDIMRICEDAVECRAVPALARASVTGTSNVLTLSQLGVWRTQTVKLIKDHRNRPSFDFPLEHKAHILSSLFVNDHVRAFCIPSVPVRKISLLECPLLHLCFQRSGDFTGYVLRV